LSLGIEHLQIFSVLRLDSMINCWLSTIFTIATATLHDSHPVGDG
jgi:hypothetical protein